MSDFLLELRSEEIPARMQANARAELEKLFRREAEAAGVTVGDITVWSTPRRLALIARGLPEATEAVSEEAKGPPEGAPDQAIEGFCRKNGVTRDQLELRDVKGRSTYFAVIEKPGKATKDLLAEAIPAIVRDFSWPKSMRWGASSISTESTRWVRPLSGIVALFDGEVVDCSVGEIASGNLTRGHRFHSDGDIAIDSVDEYAVKLRTAHVIVDHEERQDAVREGAKKAAAEAGLALVEDEGLVIENAGLTEWPVPLLGRFDESYLDVPPEVIQLTSRVNQKYFVCHSFLSGNGDQAKLGGRESDGAPLHHPADGPPPRAGEEGKLANAFICTANIDAADPAVVVDGNRKVLAARLSDARFFWELDQKTKLAEHAEKLERITFHEKLGTVADKVERVAKLARWLVEEGIVVPAKAGTSLDSSANTKEIPAFAGMTKEQLADLAEQAARLCKADLVTEMVGEFPELQGLMGGYYARAEGLPDEVADAIRDHYKPVGQGDDVPTAPVTVAVSLADKLDTLVGFFTQGLKPTGSKDPFALRRASIGVCELISQNVVRLSLRDIFFEAGYLVVESQIEKELNALRVELRSGTRTARELLAVGDNDDTRNHQEIFSLLDAVDRAQVPNDEAIEKVVSIYEDRFSFIETQGIHLASSELLDFFADRLKVQQREAGVRHDLIDAVFALGGEDDLVRLLARVHALQSFMSTEDGTNLLAGYKRAANILKKEDWPTASRHPGLDPGSSFSDATPEDSGTPDQVRGDEVPITDEMLMTGDEDPLENVDDPDMRAVYAEAQKDRATKALSYTPEPAEKALMDALDAAEPKAAKAVESEDFAAAMSALASLRAPIDTFFEDVIVNAEEKDVRAARLDLLARFRDAVHRVADFSKIEG